MMGLDLDREIYEGWTPRAFIEELEPSLDIVMRTQKRQRPWNASEILDSRKKIAAWCADNQPYYKKEVPEVVEYFCNRYNIKK